MVYEFTIEEISKVVVPVRADNADQAQRIFDKWYKEHGDGGSDTTVYDLLDNGYQGRRISRSIGQPEYLYSPDDIMLPEEADEPQEPRYELFIRFADGTEEVHHSGLTLAHVGIELASYGDKYHLFPDAMNHRIFAEDAEKNIMIYAVLKDQKETWIE